MDWIAAGQPPGAFWSATLRTVHAVLSAGRKLRSERLEDAWLTAQLVTQGFHEPSKMPPLAEITGARRKPKRQSPDQIKASIRMIVAATGGKETAA